MLRPDRATIPREKDSGSGAATTDTDLSKSAKSIMRALALLAAVASAGPAAAQAVDCNRLALQIATVGRSQAPAGGEAATRKAQAELNRLAGYAHSIGCDKPQFLFFGDRPPQCEGINAQIQRMQANVAQMQRAAYGDPGLKQQLQNKYDTWCRDSLRREPNFLEKLFGGEPDRTYPPEPVAPAPDEVENTRPSGGSMAVCVRTCDGGFFPVSYSARRGDLGQLQDLCTALCPNTEAKLYTRSLSRDMHNAVSATGEPYEDLPNAFKYEKAVDKTCTCRPPGQTWVQALANAEQLLDSRKGDLIVSPEKAEELSRPKQANSAGAPVAAASPSRTRKFDPAAAQRLLEQRKAADAQSEAERALAAQAPTAGGESSGIAIEDSAKPLARGEVRDETGPDGRPRRMRVLGQ